MEPSENNAKMRLYIILVEIDEVGFIMKLPLHEQEPHLWQRSLYCWHIASVQSCVDPSECPSLCYYFV